MTKRTAAGSIYIMILLTLFLTSLLCIRPVCKNVTALISSRVDAFRTELENKTGLTFSYSSMSPSILTIFSIKGIVLTPSDSSTDMIKIRKVVLRYSLVSLLNKDMQHAFKTLTIDGVTIDYNDASDRAVVRKLITMFSSPQQDAPFDPADIPVELPVGVVIKNVSVRCRIAGADAAFSLKKLSASYDGVSGSLAVFAGGSASGTFIMGKKVPVSGKFTVSGNLRKGLEGSTMLARLTGLSGGDFSFGKLNFLFSYAGRTVSMRTIQNAYPLMLQCSYGIDSGDASVTLRTNGLSPSSFITARGMRRDVIQKVAATSLAVNVHAEYNTKTSKFRYASDGTVQLPDSLVPGALTVSYKLSGDTKNVLVPHLALQGGRYDADLSLAYEIAGMRLSGTADLRRIELPNGGVVKTELYFDPLKRGFQCFSPEVFLNDKVFTALQLTLIPHDESIDYRFEVSDYAHPDAEKPGKIQIDGSYLTKTKYVQAGVDVSNVYLDSVAGAAAFFTSGNVSHTLSSASGALSPYLFSGEFYLSSDMKSLSYNVPYAIVANTSRDNQFLLMSLDGNESSLQVTQFDFISGKNTVHASAEVDKSPDSQGSFFTLDVNAGAVPYHFTGTIMQNFVSVAGDYGTAVQVQRSDDGSFEGSLVMDNFPVSVSGAIFTMSTETGFAYTSADGFAMNIARFEAADTGSKLHFSPKLQLSGKITRYGAFFDSVSYSDIYSALNGNAQLLVNMNEGLFNSAHFTFQLKTPLSGEQVAASADVTNPDALQLLSGDGIRSNLYFNAQVSCREFGLNRFVTEQSDNNQLTASLTATGTLDKPYVSLNIESAGLMFGGGLITAGGSASFVERELAVDDMHIKYGSAEINGIKAALSLETYAGTASAEFDTTAAGESLSLPLSLTISDALRKKGSLIPESFAATLSSTGATGTLLRKTFPFSVTILYGGGDTSLFSSENLGISGHINSSGSLNFSIADDKPFHCSITGSVGGSQLDIGISGIYADMAALMSYLPDKFFQMYGGILTGGFRISGLRTDPEFNGELAIANPDFSLPKIIPAHITTDKILVTLFHNVISVPEVALRERNETVNAGLNIYFDRWTFDRLEGTVKTLPGRTAFADLDADVAEFKGLTSVDLGILFQGNILDVTGNVYVEKVKATIRAGEIASVLSDSQESSSTGGMPFSVRTDLDILMGPHVNVILDPLLRCVLVPNTAVTFKMDQSENTYAIKGDIKLKSGDVAYLNRNFYIKQGVLKFNDTDGRINPRITVEAETRERDENGDELRIILSAENQYLSDFNPQFTTIPAKSEAEIRAMLGQLAVGDSTDVSGLLVAASDYAVQSTVGRAVENKLRDLLNFDIFSVRTMVLQNTLKMGLAGNLTPSKMTAGNFLDNSTVYIGKYFGSAVYADALLHLSYDETKVDDSTTVRGIEFQPEFGFELESPFANIRWNMAPNIDAMLNNVFVTSTSITLSWKFSF
jgi:Family of unknown function (DUF490).